MPDTMLQRSKLPPPPPLKQLGAASLFLDFDGTLIEIANGPDAIEVPGNLARRIEALGLHHAGRLALVSGRSIDNLREFLGPVAVAMAGSHGGHIIDRDGSELRAAEALPETVERSLAEFAQDYGLLYERKAHGAALHYRAKPELEKETQDFAADLAATLGLSTKRGKCVVELVRPGADKGSAVRLLAKRKPFAGATPIFIGDDVTDEDGFAACAELGGFGIVAGDREQTIARYRLNSVEDVYAWLDL